MRVPGSNRSRKMKEGNVLQKEAVKLLSNLVMPVTAINHVRHAANTAAEEKLIAHQNCSYRTPTELAHIAILFLEQTIREKAKQRRVLFHNYSSEN